MIIRGVVDRVEGEHLVVLLGDEAVVATWPRRFLPEAREGDLVFFEARVELPASEVRKLSPKSLLEKLAWQR